MEDKERLKEEEVQEVTEPADVESTEQLSEEDLEKVAGGAFPTAVNSQITD